MRKIASAVLALALAAGAADASAKPGLRAEKDINDGLFVLAVAQKIRKECGDIGGRLFRGYAIINELKARARDRGYSDSEINAYINDRAEKDRMKERRDAYIRAHGAEPKDGPSICALGQAEIDRQTSIGNLLRAK